ncbi:MAG: hypothetical protein ACO3N7_03580, partial [Kiritimatiellia bacterium]
MDSKQRLKPPFGNTGETLREPETKTHAPTATASHNTRPTASATGRNPLGLERLQPLPPARNTLPPPRAAASAAGRNPPGHGGSPQHKPPRPTASATGRNTLGLERLQPLGGTLLAPAPPLNTSPLARRLQPLGETLLAPAAPLTTSPHARR